MKISLVRLTLGFAALLVTAMLMSRLVPARSAPLLPGAPPVAAISGRVTLDNGSPAAGCSVVARSTHYVTPAPAGEAVTDADGRYRIVLDPNLSPSVFRSEASPPADTEYTVSAEGQEPLYLVPSSRTVTLPPGWILSGVDFRLTVGPQITVHIRDALSGQPVPGVTAKYLKDTDFSNNYQAAAVTDAQGRAVFHVPSLEFRLSLEPPGGNMAAVKAAPGYDFYREVRLPEVQDVVWDMKTYPTTPPTAPVAWRGVVLTADGLPAAGAKVSVLRSGPEAKTTTDDRGRFEVSLPPLTSEEYSGEYRAVAVLAEKGDQTSVLVPTSDAIWGGMSVRLAQKPLGSYAGTVVGANGRPEANVSVSCRGGLAAAYGAGINRSAATDAAGRFRLSGLPAGRYQVNLGGGAFGPETLPPSDPGYRYSSTSLTLGDGEQHDFGRLTVLPADEVLAGQIVSSDGKPVSSGLTAIVHGAHTSQTASLDTEGRFRVYHVVHEPLTLDLYRADANGATSLGQTSPDLFLKVPMTAGQEDVQVTLPPGALPPPPTPALVPAPPAPSGPPQVAAQFGMEQIAGLWLTYTPDGAAANPQSARLHVVLGKQIGFSQGPDLIWQGNMADMEGMQLTLKNDRGVLKDRTGRTLWAGTTETAQEPPAYTAVTDAAKPGFVTLLGKQGKTLWSGPVFAKGQAVQTLDGDVAVIGPAGRIVWEQPAAPGDLATQTVDSRRPAVANGPALQPFDGTLHFAAVPRRAVFRTLDGKIFYSGPLLTLLTTVTGHKMSPSPPWYFSVPTAIFPFWTPGYRGGVRCDLYDPSGKVIQTSTMKAQ